MTNRVRITICGKSYSLQTEESPAYVAALAHELEARINRFMEQNESASLTSAAVMIGLSILGDSMKSVSDVDNIRAQIKSYVEEAAAARIESDQLRRELAIVKRENENLKNDLELRTLRDRLPREDA